MLQGRLESLINEHCQLMRRQTAPRRKIQRVLVGVFVFHFLRRFPSWPVGCPPASRNSDRFLPRSTDRQRNSHDFDPDEGRPELDQGALAADSQACDGVRSEEHTSELQSLMRISYAVFC